MRSDSRTVNVCIVVRGRHSLNLRSWSEPSSDLPSSRLFINGNFLLNDNVFFFLSSVDWLCNDVIYNYYYLNFEDSPNHVVNKRLVVFIALNSRFISLLKNNITS